MFMFYFLEYEIFSFENFSSVSFITSYTYSLYKHSLSIHVYVFEYEYIWIYIYKCIYKYEHVYTFIDRFRFSTFYKSYYIYLLIFTSLDYQRNTLTDISVLESGPSFLRLVDYWKIIKNLHQREIFDVQILRK